MARFVIANRRSGRRRDTEKVEARMAVTAALSSLNSIHILRDFDPPDPLARRVVVVEADSVEMAARSNDFGPDVIIEPEILHETLDTPPPRDLFGARPGTPQALAGALPLIVTVQGSGAPLAQAKVDLYLRGFGSPLRLTGVTDAVGEATFSPPAGYQPAAAVVVPKSGFWTMVVRGAAVLAPVVCPPLPKEGLISVTAGGGDLIHYPVQSSGIPIEFDHQGPITLPGPGDPDAQPRPQHRTHAKRRRLRQGPAQAALRMPSRSASALILRRRFNLLERSPLRASRRGVGNPEA